MLSPRWSRSPCLLFHLRWNYFSFVSDSQSQLTHYAPIKLDSIIGSSSKMTFISVRTVSQNYFPVPFQSAGMSIFWKLICLLICGCSLCIGLNQWQQNVINFAEIHILLLFVKNNFLKLNPANGFRLYTYRLH